MSLLSNSLYLDSEYKADCENKINYLNFLETNNHNSDLKDVQDDIIDGIDNEKDNDYPTDITSKSILEALETKLIKAESDEKPYVSDGQYFHATKQISNNYYKILLELNQNIEGSN